MSKRPAECNNCGFIDPDPHARGYCPSCGLIFRATLTQRLRLVQLAVLGGMALAGAGVYLALFKDQLALGILVSLAGAAALGFGMWSLRHLNGAVLTALDLRGTKETMRFLTSTDLLTALVLVFSLTAIVTSFVSASSYKRRQQRQSLEAAFPDLAKFSSVINPDEIKPIDPKEVGEPRTIGRVLVLDREAGGWHVSDAQLYLPSNLRADEPYQVSTLVWIDYEKSRVGTYAGQSIPAYKLKATANIVDLKTKQTIARKGDFEGGPPPEQAPADGLPGYGSKPSKEIAEYLASLPHSPAS
jgi:hypothetical protein